jgi:hypothetical protein
MKTTRTVNVRAVLFFAPSGETYPCSVPPVGGLTRLAGTRTTSGVGSGTVMVGWPAITADSKMICLSEGVSMFNALT